MKKIRIFFTAMVLLALSVAAQAQNITVKGTVKNESGEAIVGANVLLQGSRTVYTMSDVNGAFTINVPANGVLDVNCMGYQNAQIQVNNRIGAGDSFFAGWLYADGMGMEFEECLVKATAVATALEA